MKRFVLAAALALLSWPVFAQAPPNPPPTSYQPPISALPVSLSVTNSSARVAMTADPAVYPVITIVNNGGAEIFCKPGNSSVTATTSSYLFAIYPGGYRSTWDKTSTNVACVTATSTATARISQSNGAPQIGMLGWPPAAGVGSFNGRTGLVVPDVADYATYYCTLTGCVLTGPQSFSGTAPTLSACGGGSPTVGAGSTDWVGEITEGTTATGCVVTFAKTDMAAPPFCLVTAETHLAAFDYSVTALTLTIVNTSVSGEKFTYRCLPRPA